MKNIVSITFSIEIYELFDVVLVAKKFNPKSSYTIQKYSLRINDGDIFINANIFTALERTNTNGRG